MSFNLNYILIMINIATNGKRKKQSDEQEEGTEFTFTYEMLNDTGYKNIITTHKVNISNPQNENT